MCSCEELMDGAPGGNTLGCRPLTSNRTLAAFMEQGAKLHTFPRLFTPTCGLLAPNCTQVFTVCQRIDGGSIWEVYQAPCPKSYDPKPEEISAGPRANSSGEGAQEAQLQD